MAMYSILLIVLCTLIVNVQSFYPSNMIKTHFHATSSNSQNHLAMISLPEMLTQSQYIADALHKFHTSSGLDSMFHHSSMMPSDEKIAQVAEKVAQIANDVSAYSKVDKSGFIGFLADYIERVIDFGHGAINGVGVENSYGYAIILFTIFVKIATYPLSSTQIISTSKLQKLAPLQQEIQAKYANNEQLKNKYLAKLYQVAQVNPLAGFLPAIVQIPVFMALYRALQNLIAQNKLDEPFLWIPYLEGPSFTNPPSQAMDWIKSAFALKPSYGWYDTLAYLSIPMILILSQTISQKVLQPPRDTSKFTEQEQMSQLIINALPLIQTSFSLNVPAALGVYGVVNNILTTLITLYIKNSVKDEALPPEVEQLMQMIESDLS